MLSTHQPGRAARKGAVRRQSSDIKKLIELHVNLPEKAVWRSETWTVSSHDTKLTNGWPRDAEGRLGRAGSEGPDATGRPVESEDAQVLALRPRFAYRYATTPMMRS
jgi:hypothetical protein